MIKYFLVLLLFSSVTYAHPTSSQGTISIMGENSDEMSHYDLIYSYKYWLGLGARAHQQRMGVDTVDSALGTLGVLLYRSNGEEHQGNVYLTGGLGHAWFKDQTDTTYKDDFAYTTGFQADYETRKIYTLVKYENMRTENDVFSEYYQLRAGFAPYIAGFYDLNAWFILQASTDKAVSSKIEVAPIIRIFYKNVLTEFGSSIDGNFLFNFMVHY